MHHKRSGYWMRIFLKLKLFIIFSLILTFGSPSLATIDQEMAQKAKEAESHLKETIDQVFTLIRDKDLAAVPEKHEQVLYDKALEIFDFNTFAMLSLGAKYRSFDTRQRKDFIHYFSKLISKTYFPKLAGQDVNNLTIIYLKNRPLKPKREIYRTDIETELIQGNLHIPVIYRMIQKENKGWKIYDLKIEGVSMAANYGEQYREQITITPDEIIANLKEKVNQ